jgi:hypothetical protein
MIRQVVDVKRNRGDEGTRQNGRKYGRINKMGCKKKRKKMGSKK